jgi:tetraacyldisaccharide 4'-kinase
MLIFLSYLYGKIVRKRNNDFDSGATPIRRNSVPVVSVGNCSAGGTGKTPFTQALVSLTQEHFPNIRPAIVSRGYGRTSRGGMIVANAQRILVSEPSICGDEPLLHAEALRGVPVVVHEQRASGAEMAVRDCNANAVFLDDGFQHRQLHRDVDIVLLDRQTLDAPFLLPHGRLREPLESLRRADVVCFMNGAGAMPHSGISVSSHEVYNFLKPTVVILETETCTSPLYNAATHGVIPPKTSVCAVSGIANPERFHASLIGQRYMVRETLVFRDHIRYTARHVRQMIRAVTQTTKHDEISGTTTIIATTEKDAVKLRAFSAMFVDAGVVLAVLPLRCSITRGEKELLHLLHSVFHLDSPSQSFLNSRL